MRGNLLVGFSAHIHLTIPVCAYDSANSFLTGQALLLCRIQQLYSVHFMLRGKWLARKAPLWKPNCGEGDRLHKAQAEESVWLC